MTRKEIVAASSRYSVTTVREATQPSTQGDQVRAWGFYRTPEVRSFANWIGNAMSGAQLYAGRATAGADTERVPDDHPAAQVVAEIAGGPQGQAQLLREYGRHLAVAGEGWTVIRPSTDGRVDWHVVSVLEMSRKGSSLEAVINGEAVPIPAADPDKAVPDLAPGNDSAGHVPSQGQHEGLLLGADDEVGEHHRQQPRDVGQGNHGDDPGVGRSVHVGAVRCVEAREVAGACDGLAPI
ncbi:hypothetical protein ACFU8Q_34105 [Streptomyces sp. NPDC057543]|uniref:hypothetical protein n=1 Tax=Streptomyces sp. NPDC057543 TaxID=3346163 RepID=UPI00368CEBC1